MSSGTGTNYLLDPQVSGKIANYQSYANANEAARAYTDKEILENPGLYPSDAVMKKCEVYHLTGTDEEKKRAQQMINRIWAELKDKERK